MLLATWIVVAITLSADVLVRIAPATYADAAALVPILAVAAAAHGALMVVYRMARFPERTRALKRVGVLTLAVMTVAAAALIPPYGSTGAAVASALAPVAGTAAILLRSQRGPEPLALRWWQLGAALGVGLIVVALGLAARALPGVLPSVADVLLVLAFPVLLLGLGILRREEARRLVGLARGLPAQRRQSLPAALGALSADELDLVEALLRRGEPLADVAARRLEVERATAAQLTAVLRRAGAIGGRRRRTTVSGAICCLDARPPIATRRVAESRSTRESRRWRSTASPCSPVRSGTPRRPNGSERPRAKPPRPSMTRMAGPDPTAELRATAARGLERELDARRRVRALRAHVRAAELEATRATAELEACTRRLDESLAREQELVRELGRVRTSLREGDAQLATALAARHAADAEVRARDGRLAEARARIATLEDQRRMLHERALVVRESRTYRLVRATWRVRAVLRRPSRLRRRD